MAAVCIVVTQLRARLTLSSGDQSGEVVAGEHLAVRDGLGHGLLPQDVDLVSVDHFFLLVNHATASQNAITETAMTPITVRSNRNFPSMK